MRTSEEKWKELDRLIDAEKEIRPHPFLSTRVLAAIDRRHTPQPRFSYAWKPLGLSLGIAAALFTGILAGHLYQTKPGDPDLILTSDSRTEQLGFFEEINPE